MREPRSDNENQYGHEKPIGVTETDRVLAGPIAPRPLAITAFHPSESKAGVTNGPSHTKEELLQEIAALRRRIEELQLSEAKHARAEQQLNRALQKLWFLVDACPDLFFFKDMDLRYRLVNSANAEFLGRDEADILGKTDMELVPKEIAVAYQETDRQALRQRRTVVIEESFGDKFYEARKFPVVVEGKIVGVGGVIRDITQRRRAEEALRESEKWYRTVFENTGAGTVIIEDDTTISLCNTEFERLSGYPREEIEGRKSWTEFVVQEDLERMKIEHRILRDGNDQSLRGCEFGLVQRTGEVRKIRLSVDKIHGTRKSVSSLTDITDRERAEETLRWKTALFEAQVNSSPDGILVVDDSNKRVVTNHRLVELIGPPQHVLEDEDDASLLRYVAGLIQHPDAFEEKVAYLYSHPKETGRDEIEFKNGMVLDRYSAPIIGEDGHYYGRIWTFTDITGRKQAEDGLKKSEALLKSIFEASSAGIALVVERRLMKINHSLSRITGYSGEELLGRSTQHLYLSDEEFNRVGQSYEEMQRDGLAMAESRLRRKDGSLMYALICLSPINPSDVKEGVIATVLDITDRRRAEMALKESEEKYRSLVNNMHDAVYRCDLDGNLTFTSPSTVHLMGYSSVQEVIGMNIAKDFYLYPDEREKLLQTLKERGQITGYEVTLKRRDNKPLIASVNSHFYRDRDGNIIGIEGVFRDITDRRRAEEALKESENKFKDLAEKSMVGIYLLQDGKFRYANSRCAEIYGYTHPELMLGLDPSKAITWVGGDADIRKAANGVHARIVRKDGQIRYAEVYGTSTTYLGRPAVIGTILDITDRRRNEKALRWKSTFLEALVNSSNDGILILDARLHKVMENQRFRDILKVNPEADDEERIFHLIRAIEDPHEFRQKIAYLCSQPDETISLELALKDGSTLDARSYPVLGGDRQEHYGRIWTFRDITELRRYWDVIESLSITDGLTNLSNRRRFDEYLETEWLRCMRADSTLSLILMDIDFFKEFNDHYGHLAGDDCLRQIGNVLGKTVRRSGDLSARYGGEEFACVLPGAGLQSAVALARTIMNRVDQLKIPHLYSSAGTHLTLSMGVASCRPELGISPAFLIGLADELLYSAKQAGRHRIKWQENKTIVGAGE